MQSNTTTIVLMVDKCNTSTENSRNNNDFGKPQYLKKNLAQFDNNYLHLQNMESQP